MIKYFYFVVYDYANGGRGSGEIELTRPITHFDPHIRYIEKHIEVKNGIQEVRVTNFTLLRTESDNG